MGNETHALRVATPYSKGKKKYMRSIIGRYESGAWLPYIFETGSTVALNAKETKAVLGGHTEPAEDLATVRANMAKGKRKAAKEFKKNYADKKRNKAK